MSEEPEAVPVDAPAEKTPEQLAEEQKIREEEERAKEEERKKLEEEARLKREEDMKKLEEALKGCLSGLGKSADNTSMINTRMVLAQKQIQRVFPSILKYNEILHLDMNTNAMTDISILTEFPHLVTLNLSKNQIPNLEAFAVEGKLPKLQFLNLSGNKIKEFTQVSLPSLRKLNLTENQIGSVVNWKGHAGLEILELRKNKLRNLKGITNMKNLTQLYICQNQITDLRGLQTLATLSKLSVRNNKIKKILHPFPYLPNLTYLNLRENQVSNIKQLSSIDQHIICINLLANPITQQLGDNFKKEVCWAFPYITKINKSLITEEERVGFDKERLEKLVQEEKERLEKEEEARRAAAEQAEQPPAD